MDIPAARFKATCLELMDRVASTGEAVVITKRGRPVAQLVAADSAVKRPRSGYGCMKETILYAAPMEELFSTGERWDADRRRAK